MKVFQILRLVAVALTTLLITVFLANPLIAVNPSSDKPDLNQLYQPRVWTVANVPNMEDIEQAYNSIKDVPNNQPMRIPLPSTNPRERLVAEGTIDPSTGKEVSIDAAQTRNMYLREAAIRERISKNGFTAEQKEQSTLLASMDFTNLAQYESCVFVDAYGTVRDGCLIDLVVRDYNSNQKWKYPEISIDQFCIDVMESHLNRTWF
jgi:hypothetical protein